MTKFEQDERELIENFVSKRYLPNIFSKNKNTVWQCGEGVQFIIRPQCNQKCSYCYITRFGDKLYPKETRLPSNELLNNIKILLNWFIENKVFIPEYQLFAGDIMGDKLYYKILDLFIETFSTIKIQHMQNIQKWKKPVILLPTNGYYFRTDEHQNLLREYKKKLDEAGFVLALSWSTDGLYAVDAREDAISKGHMTQEDYDKIFPFVKEMSIGIHGVIASECIHNWIKNYDWWIEMYKKYQLQEAFDGYNVTPYFLEVRNYYWTDEDIEEFKKLVRHIWDVKLKLNHNSAEKMAYYLFVGDGKNDTLLKSPMYDVGRLTKLSTIEEDLMQCNMAGIFRINVADMSLPLCHRTTYIQFNGGKFDIQDNKIKGIIPSESTSTHMQLKTLAPKFFPKCCACRYKNFCIKGCLGSQYEYSGEILHPIPTVCKLEQAKIDTLLELYNTYGVFNEAVNKGYVEEDFKNIFIYLSKKIGVFNERIVNNNN